MPVAVDPRITYVSWAESCSRSDHTARELGGSSHMVYLPRFGSRATTILAKYLGQWIATRRILRRERPDAIFVMTPPLVAAFPAFWHARRHGARVVLDAHTAAFLHPRWIRLQWLQRALIRRAATTIVHNAHLAGVVRAAGGHATLVSDVPVIFAEREPFPRPDGFVVAVVCSFNPDEPLPAVIDAARAMPDAHFFVTGDPRFFPADLAGRLPPNLTLTGFLSTPAYGGLIASADVVMALTTRDHTMLRGAFEAIYQGVPVVISDWAHLRSAFPDGASFVDNSAAGIVRAIEDVRAAPEAFRAGAARMRERMLQRWTRTREAILARLRASGEPPMLITLSGIVGSGKTTIAERIGASLEQEGAHATHWRFQNLPCFARLGRRSSGDRSPRSERVRGAGYRRTRLTARVTAGYLARIAAFRAFRRLRMTRGCHVVSRYFYDSLAHYELATWRERRYAALLRRCIPVPDLAILLVASRETIAARRPGYAEEYVAGVGHGYRAVREQIPELVEIGTDPGADAWGRVETVLRARRAHASGAAMPAGTYAAEQPHAS